MSKATRRPFRLGLCALAVAATIAPGAIGARADVSTEESGSILIFPKVLNDGTRDTVIQISNTGNTLVHAHCFYTDARPVNPNLPPGQNNPPVWQEIDFFIWLTRQQPTHWQVSKGRPVNPGDGLFAYNSGIDPGLVPPVGLGFVGELVCVEVGNDGLPVSGNKLKGEATLRTFAGDVSKYSAIAIQGSPNAGATGRTLQLDDDQYNACPDVLLFQHFAADAVSPVVGAPNNLGPCANNDCEIHTELTLVPCSRDYENRIPGQPVVGFEIFNEFEQKISGPARRVDCWFNEDLRASGFNGAFDTATLGTLTAYTRIQPVGSNGGVLGIADEFHTDSNRFVAHAAYNLQIEGSRSSRSVVDRIVLPGE